MSSSKLKIRLFDVFVSQIEQHFDVVSIFANTAEEHEKKKDSNFKVTLKTRIRTQDNFVDMLLCDMSIEGKNNDNDMTLNCVITGVFKVKDVLSLMSNEDDQYALTKATAEIVYPYMRELVMDTTKRLPIDQIIKLPSHYELPKPQKSAKSKTGEAQESDTENAEEPKAE